MPGRPTDHVNLDLTRLNLDVAFGRAGGKVIWQPRILAWYSDRMFSGAGLPGRYAGMTPAQLYRDLGVSNRVYDFGACIHAEEDGRVNVSRRDLNDTDYEVTWETPVGSHSAVFRRSLNNPWHQPLKFAIASAEDMKVAAWREAHRRYTWDQHRYDELCVEWAGLGAPQVNMPRASVQKLIVEEAGTEGTIYALADYPDVCEAYFEAQRIAMRNEPVGAAEPSVDCTRCAWWRSTCCCWPARACCRRRSERFRRPICS